ncbi:hypothetical protein AVEN_101878-1 [Araneus ventricosus]|uniref:RNase H type-1 domain-containing protein n=1 Tax=Araneus ventricosus TaxID=182803 RepID=A0A4Y2DAV0_ARAVE|nr:hypothetical protein AVEN_101878-1 [Araneus ventricosus]
MPTMGRNPAETKLWNPLLCKIELRFFSSGQVVRILMSVMAPNTQKEPMAFTRERKDPRMRFSPYVCWLVNWGFMAARLAKTLQARDFQILFCWLPGHVGIKGNELADTAAKTATTSWQQPLPYADVKKFVSHHIHNLWQGSWDLQISNKLHSIKPRITLWPALPRSIGFGLFNKRVHTKKDNSGPEDTAYHAAQQRKAITGSGKPQPLRLPCMLARIYTLVVTPWDSDHP